jgi:hypothetical protein
MTSRPRVSVVVAARNDDRGGDMLHRMQVFVNALLRQADYNALPLELIVVEWNPPADAKSLVDVVNFASLGPSSRVRLIEVPASYHARLPHAERMALFQFIAKNVGIRRAAGEYVLATNLDVLFSSPLMAFLSSDRVSPDCFYRVDRYDVVGHVPLNADIAHQLDYCARHVERVHAVTGVYAPTLPTRLTRWMARRIGIDQSAGKIHTQACGDFTLMARVRWHALRGYPEIPSHAYVDGLLCYMAASSGLRQVILQDPHRVYHQEHGQMFLGTSSERPVMDYQQYRSWCSDMMRTGEPMIINDDSWGFGRETFKEYDVASRA